MTHLKCAHISIVPLQAAVKKILNPNTTIGRYSLSIFVFFLMIKSLYV